MTVNHPDLPQVTAILAMSLDGKISSNSNLPPRFNSIADLEHLETQIALCDAIVFGGNTLRAYGTSLTIKKPHLLQQRQQQAKPPQPLNIVCSPSGNINPNLPFFSQPLPRALLTTHNGQQKWLELLSPQESSSHWQQFFITTSPLIWQDILTKFKYQGYKKIGILGGAKLMSSLLKNNLINDIWLTICPVIIGEENAINLIDPSMLENIKKPLQAEKLLSIKQIENEIFAHYLLKN